MHKILRKFRLIDGRFRTKKHSGAECMIVYFDILRADLWFARVGCELRSVRFRFDHFLSKDNKYYKQINIMNNISTKLNGFNIDQFSSILHLIY